MEMRVESLEGFSLPIGCHVAIRVGDMLKQGKYEPQRCYYFPQADKRRNAKLDLYQHVGSCVLSVDPDVKSTHEVNVTSTVASFPGTKLKVYVEGSSPEQQKKQQEAKGKEVKSQARAYLAQHCVEERLGEAVKALLKKQPEDPFEFLCQWLRPGARREVEEVSVAPPAQDKPESSPEDTPESSPEDFRKKVGDRLLASLDDGSFEKALSEVYQTKSSRPHIDTIRSKACEALVNAAQDGSLRQILKETQAEVEADASDSAALQVRARNALESALDSGQLDKALQAVFGGKKEDSSSEERATGPSAEHMAKAKDVLEKSAANGELEKALREVDAEKQALPFTKEAEMLAKAAKEASDEEIVALVSSLTPEARRKLDSCLGPAILAKAAASVGTASQEEIGAVVNCLSEGGRQKLDDLCAGLTADDGCPTQCQAEQEKAAVKIQAIHRGKVTREQVQLRKKQEAEVDLSQVCRTLTTASEQEIGAVVNCLSEGARQKLDALCAGLTADDSCPTQPQADLSQVCRALTTASEQEIGAVFNCLSESGRQKLDALCAGLTADDGCPTQPQADLSQVCRALTTASEQEIQAVINSLSAKQLQRIEDLL